MTATFAAPRPPGATASGPILLGGCVAASLDLLYICTLWATKGVGPIRILHSIAAGWLGRDAAIAGGLPTALLGLATHYLIAIAMAFAYALAARRLPAIARHPLRFGPLYGIVLYAAMNFVVVPLSAAGTGLPDAWHWIDLAHLAAHMALVGTPIAWCVHRGLRAAR